MKKVRSYGLRLKPPKIINRSGTVINTANKKEAALRDAETRLSTGGGLFGNDGLTVFGGKDDKETGVLQL